MLVPSRQPHIFLPLSWTPLLVVEMGHGCWEWLFLGDMSKLRIQVWLGSSQRQLPWPPWLSQCSQLLALLPSGRAVLPQLP